eukprot:TRINITY_DN2477_c0_g1_i1.p2 TRINITY_DN2477_c0_g1~~TRINITY_DN2477_c0_g1_i1.p2  ORF type:complete len:133 (-),score=31.47 TRINITY_DN2477_c0_g1_i1:66-464(-)
MRSSCFFFFALATVLVVSVSFGAAQYNNVHFTVEGGENQTSIAQGTELVVTFGGIPTTGYTWEIMNKYDTDALALLNFTHTDYPPNNYVYEFQAAEPASITLKFGYKQPWVSGPPAHTATLDIEITSEMDAH